MNSSQWNTKRTANPYVAANILSKWFFVWTNNVFKRARRKQLDANGLYAHPPNLDSQKLTNEMSRQWHKERKRAKPNLLHMIFRSYGMEFLPLCILYSVLEITIHTIQPLYVGGLISYFVAGQTTITKHAACLYAMAVVLLSLITALCFHPFMFYLFKLGTRVRLGCAGLVYRKCLRASMTADNSGMSGFAISVLSTDLPQFDLSFYFLHDLWKGPIEAFVFGYIMYMEIGWTAIMGICFILLFIPLQAWAAKAAANFRQRSAEHGDERVKLMNEIISAMQVIKMYAWEQSFALLIANIRKSEVRALRGSMSIYAALQCTNLISKLALFLSLVTFVYTGDAVTSRKVYILTSYYSLLSDSLLHFWPLAITTWAETLVCSRRIVKFLLLSETLALVQGVPNLAMDEDTNQANSDRLSHMPISTPKLNFYNVTASWHDQPAKQRPHLQSVTFQATGTQFVGIVGNVGAGKSTLLHAILGELQILSGHVELQGRISYAAQEPWVFAASIRENIVFVESYDAERYKTVLHVCQLERDLELMPHGDATVVGERGISLSGGQKARVSLARAIYKQADIYIFDDPLAAVDAHVGKLLMQQCFQKFLHDKLRLLVTHHVQLLKNVDHLILLEDGALKQQGSYEMLEHLLHQTRQMDGNEERKLQRIISVAEKAKEEAEALVAPPLHEREEQQRTGAVTYKTYLAYFRTVGTPCVVYTVLILFVVARTCQAAMDIFISKWATWEENNSLRHAVHEYDAMRSRMVITYAMLTVWTLLLNLLRTFGFLFMCLRISLRLHDLLFRGVIRARMYFFNTNPSGRVLNRFSSDISKVDVALPQAMLDSLQFLVNVIAALIIVAVANVWLLIPIAILIVLLYFCRDFYISASRSLKRIEALTRSPIYSHTNQTFQGLTTVRALCGMQHLETEFHGFQNNNTSALFLYVSTNRAFSYWTDLICVVFIFAVTFSFLIDDTTYPSGDVGLAIRQSMSLVIMCQWGMRQTAEMENNMTCVERVLEYAETPSEAQLETDASLNLSPAWPINGHILFKTLRLRYAEYEDYIIKGLNVELQPCAKIGIVGRTGSGKSSIIQALFRFAINEGVIEIDGCDIANVGLHDLRSRISIIPQEPVIFSGTLRFNLDPFAAHSDEQLWNALNDAKLRDHVASLEGGLNCLMQDGGANFSMGQRQLVCLARAILRHNKILILDEATANVDTETDKLIQEAIHSKFLNCTVLTIAHRLHTVMDNDGIMVMDAGQLVEFGHPHELLHRGGMLRTLVEQNDAATVNYLKTLHEVKQTLAQEKECERTVLIALDLSKAFDTVTHSILFNNFWEPSLPNVFNRWLAS